MVPSSPVIGLWLITRETVERETFASLATSVIVTGNAGLLVGDMLLGKKFY
jgi:ABC-type antimicrobial peptide transport system permease subunit